jgi:hypothetical protein
MHITSFASECGARWKCMPRKVPRWWLCEIALRTNVPVQPRSASARS